MKTLGRSMAIAIGVLAVAAGPAIAVTVTNQSDKAHEVTVDLGATEPKTTIDAGKSAKLDCPEGCEVRAVGLNSYGVSAKPGEQLSIKDGMLVHAKGAAVEARNEKGEKGKSKTMVD